MARGSAPLDGSVLPPSRIVSERQAGLPRRFMPESATGREVVALGEGRPTPHYLGRSVFFLSFAMAGLVPPFSSFFMDILEFYDLQMAHLTPNAVMTLAIFAHLCEMFIGVRPSLWLFRWFFTVQPVSPPSVVGGCYFQPRGQVLHRYIPCVLRKKWDDWKSDWFYTPLADEARLRLPSQPPAQASSWRATVDLGNGYDAVLDRLAGLRSQGLTGPCEIPSRPLRHSQSGRSEAEETATAEARRREADRREAADRLREAEEAAQEAVQVRQAEEAAREEARLRRAEESVREAEAAHARQAACQAPDPTPPEATTTSEATHDEAAGAPLGPDPSGDAQDEPASGDAPESGTSIGGPSRAAPSPRRPSPLPSATPPSAEPLLQALAAANTTVLDGLSAQMEVLQAERAELDAAWARVEEGRRSVEAMVEAGRKAHRRHASELEARRRDLAEIAREVEERETALIVTAVLNEARDDLRLQYGSRAAELEKKLDAARGVLDAAATRERRAAEIEAASRQREEALEARATVLEERARAKERDLADREATVAIREATLAAHEAACAEEESALRLREDALTERERALEEAEAAAQRLADSLFLREAAREEQARRNLEGARAERAAQDQRAAELEARAKELDARAHSGGAAAGDGDLAARLAAAEHTIAELQGALDSSAGEVEALRLAGEVGPGMLRDALSRLDRAGRQAGLWGGRTAKYAANQGGLAQRLSEMAGTLQRLPEELEETIKSSSRDLARGAVELVLASYQARDPDFSPWAALDEFPPGTEDGARAQVRDAADHIVHSFEGTAPRLAFALDSDEEGGDDGADDNDDEAGDPGASE
uniref:Retrotransposon protein, putative, unclassified n=1 Tax=Oryza sativa subsp. japonica TaxID=39947 RepID=Q2R2W5_ORYSJ|nr:retrotransposon protein, putative, unclassified [Oryza sativa Japonica Group]